MNWLSELKYNPIRPLIESKDTAIVYFTNRDLLEQNVNPIDSIWKLTDVNKILKKQTKDGFWASPKKDVHSVQNYNLIETWKQFRILVEKYELNRSHKSIEKAAEFIFSCQTNEGDIRGFLGNQYAAYYTGAIISLLLKAGYEDVPGIEKGFKWLLSIRQNDGGWVGLPLIDFKQTEIIDLITKNRETVKEWDKAKPLCINSTGMIIRAFANHTLYRKAKEALIAAQLLKQYFFKNNNYKSYKHKDHWLFFQFPYWWNNLVSALDSISMIYINHDDEDIKKAVNWFIEHQEKNGLWKISYSNIHKNTQTSKTKESQLWITLGICRILKRIFLS
jgi:hypothetical protein